MAMRSCLIALLGLIWLIPSAPAQELPPFMLVAPPGETSSAAPAKAVKLQLLTDKANQVTDEDAWWLDNELESPFLKVPNSFMKESGELPAGIPATVKNQMVVTASQEGDRPFAIYGTNFSEGTRVLLFEKDLSKASHGLDFAEWLPQGFRVNWVQVRGETLYLSYGINGYAKEVSGKTAYMAAVNLADYSVLWRSEPLVANAANFVILGNTIVAGYGFTAEPDYVFTLNRLTGKTESKLKVASGPEVFVVKGEKLYVRCYNRDLVYKIVQ